MDELVRRAVLERRLVEFNLHGLQRVAEPHLYGICKGVEQILVFQVGGQSRSGGLPNWRRVDVVEMSGLRVLDDFFAARLEALPPGWDQILAAAR
jgi:hypothetical protein